MEVVSHTYLQLDGHISVCLYAHVCVHGEFLVVSASRYDVHMILGQRSFNPALQLHHTLDGDVLSVDEMSKFSGDASLMESVFESQSRLQGLRLTDEENCLLAAFTVMSTGAKECWFR